ncbi:MAG: DUF2442 domain-containing protein [Alphaproteobacteria bacterium]|nr:DUF2442 domain-containing protein [Alphaproteobacteria bacterium]
MYIKDGIAYAENEPIEIKVWGIRPLDNYCLWLRFNTGEVKIFDFKPLLNSPAFAVLSDVNVFKNVYIDYGIPQWNDGAIDISPYKLYQEGIEEEKFVA